MRNPRPEDFSHLVGVPFVSGGRDPALGLDCWGLFMIVQRMYGREVPDVALACDQLLGINRAARAQIKILWEKTEDPGPGIAAIMGTDHEHPDIIQHFGVFIDERRIIHSLQNTGVVVDRLDVLREALCIKGLYKWAGAESQ